MELAPKLPEPEKKRVLWLEVLALVTILLIVGLVLLMIFTYRPA